MLTASDLRWMEGHRRRAAVRRLLEADDRAWAGMGSSREEVREIMHQSGGADSCALFHDRPALAQRLGCPG